MDAGNIADIVCVGVLTYDAIAVVEQFPAPDSRQVAQDVVFAGGGPAATAAVAARRLGSSVAMIGTVGDDTEGRQILSDLQGEGVDVRGVQITPGVRSAASVVLVDPVRHTRAIVNRPATRPRIGEAAAELLDGATWIHVDQMGWAPVRRYLQELPAEQHPRLSVDGGNPIEDFDPTGVDLYAPTLEALRRQYRGAPAPELLQRTLDDGARSVVATDGARGCVGLDADGNLVHAPAHSAPLVSTLGAGDVFHGALVSALHRGLPRPDAMAYANIAAALSCAAVDGRSAIPTHHDVQAALASRTTTVPEEAPADG
ncbi:PfkB family carbohydrate kinase [Pseudactinotalea sp. Z1732]|uniref:PfkB family carbohydrate kinase n=1 Tax=Micrococcales TaxID=85006 RepID=UPI003C79AC4D